MAETIGTAYIQIEPSFQGVNSAISKEMGAAGESGGSSFGSGFAKVLGGSGKMVAGAVATGGAALAAMGTAFIKTSGDVASYGDNIDKMSQKMGLSAEAYQEWDAVMQHSGTSMETMKASMKTLANAAETGKDAFDKLGISQEQVASMSQEELFEATIAGLQNVEDTTERTYLAGQLLGKGATELGALLNTSAEDTQAMRDRVHELGGVMSDDAVKAAAAYQDQLQDMQTAFSGLSRNMMAEFLPAITEVMGGLTEIFNGNTDQGIGMITNGISNIMSGLTAALPQLMQVAASIIQALATALMDNLPQIAQTGMQIVSQLATYVIENLPMLIETAAQIIMQLAFGLAEALPTLIPTIVEVILTIVDNLIDNIDLLVDCAIQLMTGLTLGLIQALPILIEKAPEIIAKLVTALIQAAPKLIQASLECVKKLAEALVQYWPMLVSKVPELMENLKNTFFNMVNRFIDIGFNLVEGIKSGIANAWSSFTGWLHGLLDGLVDSILSFFGIGSPSKLMADKVGKWIPAGIAEGIDEGMGVLDDAMESMSADMVDSSVNATLSGDVAYSGSDFKEDADIGGLYELLNNYLPMIATGENMSISLEGDAEGIFNMVKRQNKIYKRMNGESAFA